MKGQPHIMIDRPYLQNINDGPVLPYINDGPDSPHIKNRRLKMIINRMIKNSSKKKNRYSTDLSL